MSPKRKVIVAITARPSYSRIRSALSRLAEDDGIEVSVLCSGSALLDRYGKVVDLIRQDGFRVLDELYTFVEGDDLINMALTVSNTTAYTAAVLKRERPDVVVTIADRYETLGTAIAAAYMNIPLVHIQGGELTGNIDEKVRHSITKLADYHLVATDSARVRLERMGEQPGSIQVTGCPSIDLAREALDTDAATVAAQLARTAAGARFDGRGDYAVMLVHPETEAHESAHAQMSMLLEQVQALDLPILLFWPNVDAGSDGTSKAIRVFRESGRADHFTFVKNLEGHLFLSLLRGARMLIGNSSVGIRECAYLGTPVINIGDRQQGRDRAANVVDVRWDAGEIAAALQHQLGQRRYEPSHIYGNGHSGASIASAIAAMAPAFSKRFYDG